MQALLSPVFFQPLLGGVLIGLAASVLLVGLGRTAGISGILAGLLAPDRAEIRWQLPFAGGLLAGGIGAGLLLGGHPAASLSVTPLLAVAGLLVGFGTRMSNGCTSGHGVCGISRGATRSIAATLTFMASGAVTVFVVRHLLGGGL